MVTLLVATFASGWHRTDSIVRKHFALPLFEIAFVLVRLDQETQPHRKRGSQNRVNGCCASRSRLR
jgi:hypothetical protein